jgi:hypothetical protein
MEFRNGCTVRKNTEKPGPSGMSRNHAFSLPAEWGGKDCLLKVDVKVIKAMKEDMGGDGLIAFSTPEFSARAQAAYDTLAIVELTQENVWSVFTLMLPLVFV